MRGDGGGLTASRQALNTFSAPLLGPGRPATWSVSLTPVQHRSLWLVANAGKVSITRDEYLAWNSTVRPSPASSGSITNFTGVEPVGGVNR